MGMTRQLTAAIYRAVRASLTSCDADAPQDLYRLSCYQLQGHAAMSLHERCCATQATVCFLVREMLNGEDDRLENVFVNKL
jgi:hypothetical protein